MKYEFWNLKVLWERKASTPTCILSKDLGELNK